VIIQRVVELIGDLVDNVSAAVFDIGRDGTHIALAGDADMTGFDTESDHAVIAGTVYVARALEVVDRSLDPSAPEGIGAVAQPVVVSEGRVDFLDKRLGIAGVAAMMVEFEDVGFNVNAASYDLILGLFLDITAGEIGDGSGCDLRDQGVVIDVVGVISAALVSASPQDLDSRAADGEGGAFLEIHYFDSVVVRGVYDPVVAVEHFPAVSAL